MSKTINDYRNLLIKDISKRILDTKLSRIEAEDVSIGDSPIIINDINDSDGTFTLDRIDVATKNGEAVIYLDCSSAYDNASLTLKEVGLDELAGLLEWLELYEEEIEEFANETDVTAEDGNGKVKKVIRFYQRSWVDIIVEVDADADDEEVYELASERYNNGEYDDSDTDFENTNYEDVTDYYKENELPPFGDWKTANR